MVLNDQHRAILQAIGFAGATDAQLPGYGRSRELGDLSHAGLIVYWHPQRTVPPEGVIGGGRGKWCLTISGAGEADLPPLRLA